MWKLFFEICHFSCALIPNRKLRERIRKKQLFDWYNKYKALQKRFPELNFRRTKMIKGGWNIGFIVDKKYVFKIRKFFDSSIPTEKIVREKRITDAFQNISPLQIPKIEIINTDGYTFYKYNFIHGENLNTCSQRKIEDLRGDIAGDGWNHNDICNNIIVDKRTMKIVGIIDWEYSGWGTLETEFNNTVAYSQKIRDAGLKIAIMSYYKSMSNQNN